MSTIASTVFVVDTDTTVQHELAAIVRTAGWTCKVLESAELLFTYPALTTPSCVIIDIGLFDDGNLDLLRRLAVERNETAIVAMGKNGVIPMIVQVMRAGAAEFLLKPLANDALLTAIHYALSRSRTVLDQTTVRREIRTRYCSLSRREQQVMMRVVAGDLNKRIGAALGISEITVKAHRGKVMRKMRAASVAELVAMALRAELATAPTVTPLFAGGPWSGRSSIGDRTRAALRLA